VVQFLLILSRHAGGADLVRAIGCETAFRLAVRSDSVGADVIGAVGSDPIRAYTIRAVGGYSVGTHTISAVSGH
jgi:hypothetical protein